MFQAFEEWHRRLREREYFWQRILRGEAEKLLDRVIFAVALVSPVMTIPQIWKIYSSHEAVGLSFPTFAAYAGTAVFWYVYSARRRDTVVMLHATASLLAYGAVAVGIALYG